MTPPTPAPHGIQAAPVDPTPERNDLKILGIPPEIIRFFVVRKLLRGKTYRETLVDLFQAHAASLDPDAAHAAHDPKTLLPKQVNP